MLAAADATPRGCRRRTLDRGRTSTSAGELDPKPEPADADALAHEESGQSGAIAAGRFDPDWVELTKRTQPGVQLDVARCRCRERLDSKPAKAGRIDGDRNMHVSVGVDAAGDTAGPQCHHGDRVLPSRQQVWEGPRLRNGQNSHESAPTGSYEVTPNGHGSQNGGPDRTGRRFTTRTRRSVTHRGQTRAPGPPSGSLLQPVRTGMSIMAVTPCT